MCSASRVTTQTGIFHYKCKYNNHNAYKTATCSYDNNIAPELLQIVILKSLDYCSKLYIRSQHKLGNFPRTFPNCPSVIDEGCTQH